jgi:ribosomal protein S18 acetylase RimI-like enzyme
VNSPSIRRGTVDDAPQVSKFICGLSGQFIVEEFIVEARARFLGDHSEAKVKERLAGDFRFYIAEHAESIAGVAAIRSNVHLFYLFVGTAHQRTGLARRLWSQVMADSLALGNSGRFTVNASNYAVPAYERLGFRRTEPTREAAGVLYNPMEHVAPGYRQ